jgi:hypothetical protein
VKDLEQSPQGRAAGTVFRRNAAQWGHLLVERAYARQQDTDAHRSLTETALRLTEDEARQLTTGLHDLLDSWRQRTEGRDPSRRTYLYFGMLQPHPESDPGSPATRPPPDDNKG